MTILKTSFIAAVLVAGLAASASAITLQTTDGPREHGAAPQAQSWGSDARGAYASAVPANATVRIERKSQRVDIQ